jgi:peroxiredoxin
MRSGFVFLLAFVLAMVAGLGGYSLYLRSVAPTAKPPAASSKPVPGPGPIGVETTSDDRRPDFLLAGVDGNRHSIDEWDGKVILLNFWATWCPPCRREIPSFVDLQRKYRERGLVVIGIGIDRPDKVRRFVEEYGVDYVNLVGGEDATEVSIQYGNRTAALPYSVIIDRAGRIVYTHVGELRRSLAVAKIEPLL